MDGQQRAADETDLLGVAVRLPASFWICFISSHSFIPKLTKLLHWYIFKIFIALIQERSTFNLKLGELQHFYILLQVLVSELKKAYRFEKKCKIVFIGRWHIVYVENLREATKRGIRNGKFSKVSGYKVNIKKSIVFLYINKPLESKIKNTIYNSIKMWKN